MSFRGRFFGIAGQAGSLVKSLGLSLRVGENSARKFSNSVCLSAASCQYRNGLVVITLPLPSRKEDCEFTLKPVSHSIRHLTEFIQEEDGGIDRAVVYSKEGVRVSNSTPIEILLQNDFDIVVNEEKHEFSAPEKSLIVAPNLDTISDVKNLVTQLYTNLNAEEYKEIREKAIQEHIETLKSELKPLEMNKAAVDAKAAQNTRFVVWAGLGYMALQFGFLARLTWWEYSWDIMEPVTYFITYGTSMAAYAYFVLTRQEFLYPDARNREYLLQFHKNSKKTKFDISSYNAKKDLHAKLEEELKVLRNPAPLLPEQTR